MTAGLRKIKNSSNLLNHGDIASRKIILDITEKTLEQLDAYRRITSIMSVQNGQLTIGQKKWNLKEKKNIYLLGAGKACNSMAKAVSDILGDYLTKGIIIVKILEAEDVFPRINVYVGGHPLPNQEGLKGSKEILKLVDTAGPDDLFIAVMSGGSSALMSYPRGGISLDDEIKTTDILLKSGANIGEINAIRRHISNMNGGMLAKRIAEKGAELIGFNISDGVGRDPTKDIGIPDAHFRATPIGPDQTTLADARNVVEKFALRNLLPQSVIKYLDHAGPESETPKAFPQNTYYLLNTVPDSCLYAKKIAEEMGLRAYILTSFIDGEAKEWGKVFATLAKQIQTFGMPFIPPCVVLASGEAVTTIEDSTMIKGHGGPGQELTLSFAEMAKTVPGCAMLSIDSEGTDGTTPVAGGLTDSQSFAVAQNHTIIINDALRNHASYEALEQMGDVVFTGNTGTNVCDFNIMYVPEKGSGKSNA